VCSGTAYLNDGGEPGTKILGKSAYWVGSKNSFMVPANVDTANMSTSASIPVAAGGGFDNPDCQEITWGDNSGWLLTSITRGGLGLPTAIATPLKLQ
jgi:hypothetical protein